MSLVLDLPSELEAELATDAARLGLSLAEYAVRRIVEGRVESRVTFQLIDGTVMYLLESSKPIDLNDDAAVAKAQVKTVKIEAKTPFMTRTQEFTNLSASAIDGFVKLLGLARGQPALQSGAELLGYWQREGLVGTRRDITDSQAHARALRQQAERRPRQ
jgi:hypothetical protein